jgi:hypothetical protein
MSVGVMTDEKLKLRDLHDTTQYTGLRRGHWKTQDDAI